LPAVVGNIIVERVVAHHCADIAAMVACAAQHVVLSAIVLGCSGCFRKKTVRHGDVVEKANKQVAVHTA